MYNASLRKTRRTEAQNEEIGRSFTNSDFPQIDYIRDNDTQVSRKGHAQHPDARVYNSAKTFVC